jgi:hypothetical protein
MIAFKRIPTAIAAAYRYLLRILIGGGGGEEKLK